MSLHIAIILIPKLQQEEEFRRLREHLPSPDPPMESYIPLFLSIPTEDRDNFIEIVEFLSKVKQKLSPIAVVCENWHESGDLVIGSITQGREGLRKIREEISGPPTIPLGEYTHTDDFRIILWRITNPEVRREALIELLRIGKSLGVIDSLFLTRMNPDGSYQRIAKFPFGVGGIDFYELSSD